MSTNRRRLIIGLSAVAVIVVLAFAVPYVYVNYIADDAPAPLALDTQSPKPSTNPSESPDPSQPSTPVDTASADGAWAVGAGSEAGYRVDEVLNGQDNTVVGRTSDVSGEVVVAGGSVIEGRVEVDMTTVTTDSGSRDSQFQGNIMNTAEFPTSQFVITAPVDLGALGDGSTPVTVTAPGELTIHGVTQPVEAELQVQVGADGTAQVAGSIPVTFEDYGVDAPDLGFVKVEDAGLVEFLLDLQRS